MKFSCTPALVASITSLYVQSASASATANCKCGPNYPCWPSKDVFDQFNSTISGKLIRDSQPARVCYPGPDYDKAACAVVNKYATDSVYLSDTTVGLSYPVDIPSCPPVEPGQAAGNCSIGSAPRYTVNATTPQDVAAGIKFAKEHNIRLVVRNTGHDLLGRSTGAGSLQIWMRYIRDGIKYHDTYKPSDGCSKTDWSGSAFTIGGGYVWGDVNKLATSKNRIIVGGGDPTVSCVGGWMQGGGHSPAAHDFGLGADQVLEAQVVLANGSFVTANACQNPDLFFAIRGGGPGTYGVVTSTTIKAYPERSVVAHSFGFAPLTNKEADMERFMEAVADVYSAYPDLSDQGYNGYGSWSIATPTPLVANYSVGFTHLIAMFNTTLANAKKVANPYMEKVLKYNGTSLYVTYSFDKNPSYSSYYEKYSGVQQPVGTSSALGSRLLDRAGLTGDRAALMKALNVTAGTPDEFTSNNIIFVGGGAVSKTDSGSAVLPAWRKAYVHNIVARGWAPGSDLATINAVHKDITYKKIGALRKLVPDSGAYMNEADRRNQFYAKDYYGGHLKKLNEIKRKYDADGVFYCKTCVGSGEWEFSAGHLCRTR